MKIRHLGLAGCVLILQGLTSCSTDDRTASFADLDHLFDAKALEYGVPGYALAVFDDEKMLYHRWAGYKNADTQEPIDAETVFEAASISKPVFAYIVLTMARADRLGLDDPIGALDPVPVQLGYDERSNTLTPRMLLRHRGGLPNWRTRINFDATVYDELFGPSDTLRFVATPGAEHKYSGEGYVLLQQVVERSTQRSLNELATEVVFDPLEMHRSSFRFDDVMRTNASNGHDADGRPDKWEIAMELASSTLHTTAADLAKFGVHVASAIRDGTYYSALAQPGEVIASDGLWEASWGLGLGVVTDSSNTYVYHGGNNVIFIADFVYNVESNVGYALLTNSANGKQLVEAVEQRIFGKDIPRI